MEYAIPFILVIIGIIFNSKMTPVPRKIFLGLICAYLVILLGLRYCVGVDTISYTRSFKHIPPIDRLFDKNIFTYRYEPGYLIINSIVKYFTHEFWPVQMIVAAILNGSVFVFLYKYCKNVFIGIFFFLILQWFYFSMEIMRESIAVSIFLLNYRNLEHKNWVRYYLFSILSVFFHYSAAITLFMPLARILKPNLTFLTLCLCALAVTPLVERFNDMISTLSIAARFDQYVSNADNLNLNWKLAELMKSGFPAIVGLMIYLKYKIKCKVQQMLLVQIALCVAAFAVPLMFSRFTNYTSMFVTVAIANIMSDKRFHTNLRILLFAFVLLTQSFFYATKYQRWYPYVSIFDPHSVHAREQIWKHDFITW